MKEQLIQINGYQFYSGLTAGISNLLNYKNKLDEINVYPVPDGDTGTNMCFTLLPVVEECNTKISENISDTLDVIADTALDSARGNSGTIIAQFLHGMRKGLKNLSRSDNFQKMLKTDILKPFNELHPPKSKKRKKNQLVFPLDMGINRIVT